MCIRDRLASIRRHIRATESKVRDILQKIISSSQAKYLQESIITQRSGRYVVPVKSEFKNEIPGLVHDLSLIHILVGEKVAIVSSKPQTTRNRICGVLTRGENQFVFLDTPGLHRAANRLGDYMVDVVRKSVADVDAVLLLVEPIPNVGGPERELIDRIKEMCIRDSPSIVANAYSVKRHYFEGGSLHIHFPMEGLSTAENFLRMIRPNTKYTEDCLLYTSRCV